MTETRDDVTCDYAESIPAPPCVLATELVMLRAKLAGVREELRVSRIVANDGYKYWDNDQDSKAGKMLLALSGVKGIRVDLDTARDALSALGEA